jgi:hypothetical protein
VEHAESEKRQTGSVPPFTKMVAVAILKIIEVLLFGHLSPDFDEIWYAE